MGSPKISNFWGAMVVLAQLAEHRIVVPSVVGSSPTFHPKTKMSPLVGLFFCFYGVVRARSHLNRVPKENNRQSVAAEN